jgi:tetratricopeptide (TPR) repeat protein
VNRRGKVGLAVVLLLFVVFALGQSAGSSGTPTTGGNKPTTPTTPTTPTPTSRQPTFDSSNPDPFSNNSPGINGRLIPNTGSRTEVNLYQDGVRLDTTFSQSDGSFNFLRGVMGRRYEIRVVLGPDTEFREEIEFMPGYPALVQINNPARIVSTNPSQPPSSGVVSLANLAAPKKALSEMDKGRELGNKKKYDEAMQHLQKAVEIYAKYPEAYNEMGLIQRRQAHDTEAEEMFRKAIEADPKWTAPYLNLAQLQLNKQNYAELLKTTEKVLQLDKTLTPAHFYGAVGYYSTGKLDLAEKEALAAEVSAQQIPQVHLILGNIYEARGNFSEAVARYKLFLKVNPTASNAIKLTEHIAQLERQ